MLTSVLKQWATANGEGPVADTQDRALSLTSKLLRFRWEGAHAVGVGSDQTAKVRINAVLDAVSWYLAGATDETTRFTCSWVYHRAAE